MSAIGAPTMGHFRLRDLRAKPLQIEERGPTSPTPYTRNDRIALMRRWEVLLLVEDICEVHNVDLYEVLSASTASHVCAARHEIAATLYSIGLTLELISKMLDRHSTTIRGSAILFGVTLRKRGRRAA